MHAEGAIGKQTSQLHVQVPMPLYPHSAQHINPNTLTFGQPPVARNPRHQR